MAVHVVVGGKVASGRHAVARQSVRSVVTRVPTSRTIPDEVESVGARSAVRRDLLSLDKNNANAVARHIVMLVG
ncbi:hypothetical protein GS436_18215 [Rhodococcus hoagii]|nr:hypothetical protein [Prescottella equi]